MSWQDVFEARGKLIMSSTELKAFGATSHAMTAAVRGGHLIRARRDHYALPATDVHIVEAVRVGGRLGCVSALNAAGLFAFDASRTHIHMDESMSRSRSPRNRRVLLTPFNRDGAVLHWRPLFDGDGACEHSVSILDALGQSLRCQEPWHALASIDNALFLGLIAEGDLTGIFASASSRVQYLRSQFDGRAESGQETVLRMIVQQAGLECDLQVTVPSIGRVDLVVEGCLVLEADSRLAHDGWEKHVEDRGRDLLLATQGYMSLRPAYQHTMHAPGLVRDAIVRLVAQHRQFRVHVS